MKVKINKLLAFTEQNKKYKTAMVTVDNKNYYISPHNIDKNNFVGINIQFQFICTMPDQNFDYEYLRCNVY